jgi:hypothetical protein
VEKLDKEGKQAVKEAFETKYGEDPNLNEVVMRYNVYEGDWIQVKVKDIWAADDYPNIFNGHGVFVEEAPPVRTALTQD